jgi:hypothetical protein
MREALLLFPILFALGCRATLQDQLGARGVRYDSCGRIDIVGSEADVGDFRVPVVSSDPDFQNVWTAIIHSRPYKVWYASGYRRIEFFLGADSTTAVATLLVNESGGAHVKEAAGEPQRFYCPGLHELAMRRLRERAATSK